MESKVLVFSAPSGSGKSTIINYLLERYPCLEFSISATSRQPRGNERDGVEYYFINKEDFKTRVAKDDFLEWEEVYSGSCYGTLNSELDRIWSKGNVVVFDIDVKGAINIKNILKDKALTIFIMPPSIETLRQRLLSRGTDTIEAIEKRLSKAEEEISEHNNFDVVIINDNLSKALERVCKVIEDFIGI